MLHTVVGGQLQCSMAQDVQFTTKIRFNNKQKKDVAAQSPEVMRQHQQDALRTRRLQEELPPARWRHLL